MKSSFLILLLVMSNALWSFSTGSGQDAAQVDQAGLDRVQLDRQLHEAELLLESARKPDEAAGLFRSIWKAPSASREMKGKALAGLIHCEQLLGRRESAESLLRELLDEYRDLPSISMRIRELSSLMKVALFLDGIEILSEGRFLDLDTGGSFTSIQPGSGMVPELVVRNRRATLLVDAASDQGMKDLAPWLSDAPWRRVQTDLGRTAWLQVLRESEPVVVRYYTRISGSTGPLPAPQGPFSLGLGNRIEIHFLHAECFISYRIERRDSPDEPFRALANVHNAPYVDAAVTPDSRYVYRIIGIAKDGSEGLPATLDATTETRGVFSGSVELNQGSLDLLTGRQMERGGDITLKATYGGQSAASFIGYLGIPITVLKDEGKSRPSPWGKWSIGWSSVQIPPNVPFLVPLSGGGVARCTWVPTEKRGVLLNYEVNPDAAHFIKPYLIVEKKDGHAEIRTSAPPGYEVEQVTVTDLLNGGTRTLEVAKGMARDEGIREGNILSYSAAAADAHGRHTAKGKAHLKLLSREIRKGEFEFHYEQAYSFDYGRIVSVKDGDVLFKTCAGGISSVTLHAPAGITNLGKRRNRDDALRGYPAEVLMDAIVSFDPRELKFEDDAKGDKRTSTTDTFLLKTKHGAWVKCAIVHRSDEGGWTERPVTIRYVYNAWKPEFGKSQSPDLFEEQGVAFDRSVLQTSRK